MLRTRTMAGSSLETASELANTEAGSGFIEDALAAEPEINALAKTIPNPRPDPPGMERIEIESPAQVESWIWESYLNHLADLHDLDKGKAAYEHVTGTGARRWSRGRGSVPDGGSLLLAFGAGAGPRQGGLDQAYALVDQQPGSLSHGRAARSGAGLYRLRGRRQGPEELIW